MFSDDFKGAWKGVAHDVKKFVVENKLKLETKDIYPAPMPCGLAAG
ncbi:hypothetical protein ACFL52_05315 [Candidatus Margulisiibacteriota bacterium]